MLSHMMTFPRRAAVLISLVASSCASAVTTAPAPVTSTVVVPAPAPVVVADPLEAFGGVYAIAGAPVADGCGGEIVLAARTITVNPAARTLFADVVNRTYTARVEDGRLIAEGHFQARGTCPETVIFERWILTLTPDGRLEGTLESLWPRAPDCANPCLITFVIAASRT